MNYNIKAFFYSLIEFTKLQQSNHVVTPMLGETKLTEWELS
jgi:hypothetical protein